MERFSKKTKTKSMVGNRNVLFLLNIACSCLKLFVVVLESAHF